ncbi:GntR family transcriptional regulator [Georgenia wutianyii]|uniref:GntR family transcriptional regulator n=1 Tax=Georgenia wutianyii TaxID=2585135 RepID=A0ABX5VJK9_9MICO|nr:GntR family transcriptional regulator [Georgenia wutianyii]QDB78617.1 GntR family transcriptional regulator [Georgenia wutianyii]
MKYLTVREHLRSLIAEELGVGDAIPSERELCGQFGVSRMTVRQAVDALVVEGLLERVQGRGTFVAQPKVDLQLRLASFPEEMRRRGMEPDLRVLAAELTAATPQLAAALELPVGADVYYLRRLRLADGLPMAVEQNWVPAALVPDLLEPEPASSVYDALAERELAPTWGEDVIEAVQLDEEVAGHLGISPGAAGLQIRRRTFSGDLAVDYGVSVYRGDRYSLWVPVSAPGPTLVPSRRRLAAVVGTRNEPNPKEGLA